jgi:hypothetical protein
MAMSQIMIGWSRFKVAVLVVVVLAGGIGTVAVRAQGNLGVPDLLQQLIDAVGELGESSSATTADLHPYQETKEILGSQFPNITFSAVPPGMRLVVERVSGLIVLNPDDRLRYIYLTEAGTQDPKLYLSGIRLTGNTTQEWNSINDEVLAYFEPGEIPRVVVRNDKVDAFNGIQGITLTGHFVPLP